VCHHMPEEWHLFPCWYFQEKLFFLNIMTCQTSMSCKCHKPRKCVQSGNSVEEHIKGT
jgi:hypothetical protein